MVAVTSYFAKVGIDVDQSSLKKVDDYFKALDTKMQRYKGKLGNGLKIKVTVDIDTRATMLNLRRKLDTVAQGMVLKIKRVQFDVNGKQIRSQAEKQLSAGIRVRVFPFIRNTNIMDLRRQLIGGLQSIPISLRYSGNFRETVMNRINAAIAPARRSGGGSGSPRSGSGGGGGRSGYDFPGNLMMGPTGRLLRMGAAAVPFVGGAIGLGNLNRANTEYQSQKIAAEGVFEKYGGGQAALEQLFALSQKRGIDYKKTLPQFTQFMASAMPAMGYDTSFKTFQGFLEFGRARGATAESMDRALYAVSQMSGKGKISSEELNQQLGDAAGFGEMKAIFAQAYAQKTGSGLVGQKAIADLTDAMKKGKVISEEILPIVAQIASGRVAGVIEKSSQSADANQNRYNNARNRFLAKFSESGGEAALSKMWDALAKLMDELGKRAPALVSAFSDLIDKFVSLTKVITDLWSLWDVGAGNATTMGVKDATGLNLVAIRDFFKGFTDIVGKITEQLGFTYSVLAAITTFYAAKLGFKYVSGKISGGVATATGGAVGSLGMAAFAQSTAMGQAIRVWVVNSTNQQGLASAGGAGTPGSGSAQQGGWRQRLGGVAAGIASVFGGGWGLAGAGLTAGSYFVDDPRTRAYMQIAGQGMAFGAAGLQYGGPWGGAAGLAAGIGLGAWQNADTLFGSTVTPRSSIAAAAPVAAQARDSQMTFTGVSDIKLQADIKITAQDGIEAFQQFQDNVNLEMENAIRGHLLGAQTTWADYAR